jgi:hypothetical protein
MRFFAIAVGAPNDVWITMGGQTYPFDPTWLTSTNPDTNAWIPRNMGTQMPVIDVGVDGHLWGIGAGGRVFRWLGLRS